MRTPNTQCEICKKPLYRRPSDLARYSGVCCIECRSEYYKSKPVSPNLALGRQKGTNHLEGIPKSKSSNKKRSRSHKKWCRENPDKVKARGEKVRGENHYRWKGGVSRLNTNIRRMHENRIWSQRVRERDGKCLWCGATENLDADHIKPLVELLEEYRITNREQARNCKELWDINNGQTLCKKCHCKKDNRKYSPDGQGRRQL